MSSFNVRLAPQSGVHAPSAPPQQRSWSNNTSQNFTQHLQSQSHIPSHPQTSTIKQSQSQPQSTDSFVQGNQHVSGQQTSPRQMQSSFSTGCDVRRVLHLYMHDYCLKQNFSKSANAIASDSGVRTDEGVPIGSEAPGGLLLQWFAAFWNNYASSQGLSAKMSNQSEGHTSRPQTPFLNLSLPSTAMRRHETEPVRRSASSFDASQTVPTEGIPISAGGTAPPGVYSNAIKTGHQSGDSQQQAFPHTNPHVGLHLSMPSSDATSALQQMGWNEQSLEALSGEEKAKLYESLKRSQMAQQEAIQRMTQVFQGNMPESSAHRAPNGSVFQQSPVSSSFTQSEQWQMSKSPSTGKLTSPQQQSVSKKSPNTAAAQRKKRRSSISMQAVSQLQQQQNQQSHQSQQSQQQSSPMDRRGRGASKSVGGLTPSPSIDSMAPVSPAQMAQSMEEQQAMARRLQVQSQGILGQQQQQQQQHQQQSISMSRGRSTGSSPSNAATQAHQAQSEAASHATQQLSEQINRLQNQTNRTSGQRNGNATTSHQISQLKALQGKLTQMAKGADDEWTKRDPTSPSQGPAASARPVGSSGEMGPPPSPNTMGFFSQQQQQQQQQQQLLHHQQLQMGQQGGDLSFGQQQGYGTSNPSTPAMTASSSFGSGVQQTPDWHDAHRRSMQDSPVIQTSNPSLVNFEQQQQIGYSPNHSVNNPQQRFDRNISFNLNNALQMQTVEQQRTPNHTTPSSFLNEPHMQQNLDSSMMPSGENRLGPPLGDLHYNQFQWPGMGMPS